MKAILKEYFTGCLTIPNLLSVIRIALIPVFGVLYYNGNILWAVVVLFVSGLTDFFDGKIARKFNQISALGKVLDPVADKLTQITIAVMLLIDFIKFFSKSTTSLSINLLRIFFHLISLLV